jgi:hypothetical protein
MMKGVEFAEVRDAIAHAFIADEFDMFLYERLNFDRSLNIPDGAFRVVVTNVLGSGKAGRVRYWQYGQAEKSPDLAISDPSRFLLRFLLASNISGWKSVSRGCWRGKWTR